jgi:hypothetical protein
MAISAAAKSNHDQLFGDRVSTLAQFDPELIDYFGNLFSMLVALGGADAQVRGHVNGNLRVGNTRARLLAVLTALVRFIGYPRTLNGLAALNDITSS